MGLGAIIDFIPAAIIEAKLTKQEKLAQKISVMRSIKNIQNPKKFADYTSMQKSSFYKINDKSSEIFDEFLKYA